MNQEPKIPLEYTHAHTHTHTYILVNASVTLTSQDNGRLRRNEQFSSLTSAGHESENKNRRKKNG